MNRKGCYEASEPIHSSEGVASPSSWLKRRGECKATRHPTNYGLPCVDRNVHHGASLDEAKYNFGAFASAASITFKMALSNQASPVFIPT